MLLVLTCLRGSRLGEQAAPNHRVVTNAHMQLLNTVIGRWAARLKNRECEAHKQ